uniref:Nebulin n=1 Tax=Eptatretus burgeri TaxID=7764 RepID=A0A8C4NHH9_EPTBU
MHLPLDMLDFVLAKKCQHQLSDVNYKNVPHNWTCLPDKISYVHAKNAYELQSDNIYKADLEWLRGIGWAPTGSLEMKNAQRASEILSEKKYRQHPSTLEYTSLLDDPFLLQAKINSHNLNNRLYREAWDSEKTQVHVMPDTPFLLQAKLNALNISDRMYRMEWAESRKHGHDIRPDAIPICAAKAVQTICSDYKYKEGYRKQIGHHIGSLTLEGDLKLANSMKVARIQSEREYKKVYEKYKTDMHLPLDMLDLVLAKKCQHQLSDVNYKNVPHDWTCLVDNISNIRARIAYELQSNNAYKADLEWLRGTGWVPTGSLDMQKAQRASEILSDKNYRQHPDTLKFTSIVDDPIFLQAKINSQNLNDVSVCLSIHSFFVFN